MKKFTFFGLIAVLGFATGCRPSLPHVFHAPSVSVAQTQGETRVAVPSAYEACVEKHRLSPALSAPEQRQEVDENGAPVVVLQANRLAMGSERVQKLCEKEVELQYLPQPQTCWPSAWGGYICR
jgi:hypothetical protein